MVSPKGGKETMVTKEAKTTIIKAETNIASNLLILKSEWYLPGSYSFVATQSTSITAWAWKDNKHNSIEFCYFQPFQ